MRIRSALAATVLAAALTAVGATTATAANHEPRHYGSGDDACDVYFGGIDTVSSDIFWGGAYCRDHH